MECEHLARRAPRRSRRLIDPPMMTLFYARGSSSLAAHIALEEAGATFATVLASVDEFAITGAVPGFFFTNADFDVQIDNIMVTVDSPVSVELPEVFYME